MTRVALGLGSSLGDRRLYLENAMRALGRHPEIDAIGRSRWYRTPPMRGGTARNPFLNGVLLLDTTLSPEELLEECQRLETLAGRRRARFWGDRTLDIDILLFGGHSVDTALLSLPHPGVTDRPFFLLPLLEVWPDARNPRTNKPYAREVEHLKGRAWPIPIPRPLDRLLHSQRLRRIRSCQAPSLLS